MIVTQVVHRVSPEGSAERVSFIILFDFRFHYFLLSYLKLFYICICTFSKLNKKYFVATFLHLCHLLHVSPMCLWTDSGALILVLCLTNKICLMETETVLLSLTAPIDRI